MYLERWRWSRPDINTFTILILSLATTFKAVSIIVDDERFKVVEIYRDREDIFVDYISKLEKKAKVLTDFKAGDKFIKCCEPCGAGGESPSGKEEGYAIGDAADAYPGVPWAVYESEKKLYNDHLESLQSMEKNYNTMAQEVEKLRFELNNTANELYKMYWKLRSEVVTVGVVGGLDLSEQLGKSVFQLLCRISIMTTFFALISIP